MAVYNSLHLGYRCSTHLYYSVLLLLVEGESLTHSQIFLHTVTVYEFIYVFYEDCPVFEEFVLWVICSGVREVFFFFPSDLTKALEIFFFQWWLSS